MRTRLLSPAVLSISTIFVIWDENVESDCSILCSSPISARTLSKTDTRLLSETGSISPHSAIKVNKPIVLIETVLPPVFAPVITRESKSIPNEISTGTTDFASIKGWRAFFKSISPSLLRTGRLAFILYARCAFAKIKSRATALSKLILIVSWNSPAIAESSAKMRSISSCSRLSSTLISLFASTTAAGSINTVAPLPEVSCTIPWTSPLFSDFTGTTKRPLRCVIILSRRYFE